MGLDEVYRFMHDGRKLTAVDRLYQQGVLTDEHMTTLREAAAAYHNGEITLAAITRWVNSKDGVMLSPTSVRNWVLSHD